MSEQGKSVSVNVIMENGVVKAGVHVDIIEALRALAKQSDNTIDDTLVEIFAKAQEGLDWKGFAKEVL